MAGEALAQEQLRARLLPPSTPPTDIQAASPGQTASHLVLVASAWHFTDQCWHNTGAKHQADAISASLRSRGQLIIQEKQFVGPSYLSSMCKENEPMWCFVGTGNTRVKCHKSL
uniref:Uncharacterized protein n=1 Tax=Sphaerodactylus townsendi TaxID=933632 RepID=A0ACB8EIA8_9SAUR